MDSQHQRFLPQRQLNFFGPYRVSRYSSFSEQFKKMRGGFELVNHNVPVDPYDPFVALPLPQVWCPPEFNTFVLVDDSGKELNRGGRARLWRNTCPACVQPEWLHSQKLQTCPIWQVLGSKS